MGQLLDAPKPRSIHDVVGGLGMVQEDPTSVVARTEHLVLWSRLGRSFRVAELERLLYSDRKLFEYWVHILPIEDFPIHREAMRRYPATDYARHAYVREWLAANDPFRRYVLRELKHRGPLRSRDFEDRTAVPWRTGGWNDARPRHIGMLLDILWSQGRIAIVGRDGNQRLWDLAERAWPVEQPRPSATEVARRLVDRQLRARGVDRDQSFGWAFGGVLPGRDRALASLTREGVVVPVRINGVPGRWFAHGELLDRRFKGRTAILSPFDDLVADRTRTKRFWDMEFRLEIYVPKAKRRWGYFVLPVLVGDRLVGRLDPAFDREASVLRVNAVHAEPEARRDDRDRVLREIEALATWLGAGNVTLPTLPSIWR
jgi:uncharacterized protein YcaQ